MSCYRNCCDHCYHAYCGPIWMVIPQGHVILQCCKCHQMTVVHHDHWHHIPYEAPYTFPTIWYTQPSYFPCYMPITSTKIRSGDWSSGQR